MNVGFSFSSVLAIKKQFFDQVNIRLISKLIHRISSAFEKLLRYFNGTIISTPLISSLFVCPVISYLNLNELLSLSSTGKSIATLILYKAG